MRLKQNKKKIELLKLSNVLKRAAKKKQSELDNILKKKGNASKKKCFLFCIMLWVHSGMHIFWKTQK